jgi:glucan phosphoethanolaminetransferase (alkaline phosphatase superfamily)
MENLIKNSLSFFNKHKKQIFFYVFINICVVFFITLSSYIHIPLSGFKDRLMYVLHLVLLQFSVAGFIYVLSLNKWLFRLVFSPLFLFLSLFSYWVYTQDVSITNALIQSSIETKPSIVLDLLTLQYISFIIIVVFVILYLNRLYNKIQPNKINVLFVALAIICISSFTIIENNRNNTLKSRLPYNVFFGLKEYYSQASFVIRHQTKKVQSPIDSLKIILVIGESVRADHLKLNGYYRNTNPFLFNRNNIISFKNVYTPYTTTASSLPRIISDYSVNEKVKDTLNSLFDVFNNASFSTFWYGNQELERSYSSIVKTNKKVVLIDSLHSVLSFNKTLDENLIPPFLADFKNESLGLFTLHMMGSHWWYENRYNENSRIYKPVIDSKHIPSLTKEQLVNSYDNTIIYLDTFLNNLIRNIEDQTSPIILIYLSDHGEILGEDNKWLHAQKSTAAQNPAMIIWYSNHFKQTFPDKVNTLVKNKDKAYTTDLVYNSLLQLIDIHNYEINEKESIFN